MNFLDRKRFWTLGDTLFIHKSSLEKSCNGHKLNTCKNVKMFLCNQVFSLAFHFHFIFITDYDGRQNDDHYTCIVCNNVAGEVLQHLNISFTPVGKLITNLRLIYQSTNSDRQYKV